MIAPLRPGWLAFIPVLWPALAARAEAGFVETFDDDPIAAGRFEVHDGDPSRFVYRPAERVLLARYNSLHPTARLVRKLCRPLNQSDAFDFEAVFRLNGNGFVADPRRYAQIAFGLMNAATTGHERVYGLNGQGSFDLLSFDYYPNVTLFGGPSAGVTIIQSDTGIGYAGAIHFAFGSETALDEAGEAPLPLDEWLTAEVRYDGPARRARLRILHDGQPLPINAIGADGRPGGDDADPATIVTTFGGPRFRVDRFGIFLWRDTSASFASLIADVEFRRLALTLRAGGDFDRDGDVDGNDLERFASCAAGPRIAPPGPDCADADLDCDGDVDQADFGLLQAGMTVRP